MNSVEPIRSRLLIKKIENYLLKNERNRLLFIFGINTGLRISDILKLKVKDVKNKKHIELIEKKTGKIKKFLLNKRLEVLINNFINDKDENSPLFKSKKGGFLTRIQAYKIINAALKHFKFKGKIGTHTLRKTFAYHHYQKFHDIALLQIILNHSAPCVTLKYIGINQDIIDESYRNFEI